MANSFHRVSQSLGADSGRRSNLALLIAMVLMGAWLGWAFQSRITRYEISDSARLEVDRAAYPIQAISSGRLTVSNLVLGNEVHAGDVLAELDSTAEHLSLQQERTRLAAFHPQLAALESQMASEDQGGTEERGVLALSVEGARAQYREAEGQAVAAEQQAARASRLQAEGILAQADAERAKADALSKRAAADNLKIAISRLEPELKVREQDREARKHQIATDIAELQAGIASSSAALGKIHAGQHATVRLEGFPWAQYGTLPATVSRTADEIRDGKVRVELAIGALARSPIPLQHGLPGSVEVEVERVSPAALLLRSAGAFVGAR